MVALARPHADSNTQAKRRQWSFATIALVVAGLVACATTSGGSTEAARSEARDRQLRDLVPPGFAGTALAMRGDEVLLMEGFGLANRSSGLPNTADTLFQPASVSKQFTAAGVLRLQADGRLHVDDPIGRHLDNVPLDKHTITIHQLLTHTSGLPHRVGQCSSDVAALDREAYLRLVLTAPLEAAPGTRHIYSNDGYGVLGAIIERVSGLPYERFLRERLFDPAGMERAGYTFPPEIAMAAARGYGEREREFLGNLNPTFRNASGPAWCNRASGGLLSTTRDMQRWMQALRTGRVLPADEMRAMLTPHVPESPDGESHHGYGWTIFLTSRGTRLAMHDGSLSGYFTAELRWYLDEDVVVYVAANSSGAPAPPVARALAAALLRR